MESAFRKYFHRADPGQLSSTHHVITAHGNLIRYFILRLATVISLFNVHYLFKIGVCIVIVSMYFIFIILLTILVSELFNSYTNIIKVYLYINITIIIIYF